MTAALQLLVATARALAEPEVVWVMVGGRGCPIDWEDCSQPVFESACGRYTDHGERGGSGDRSCRETCKHGLQPPPIVCVECGDDAPCGESGPCGPWGSVTARLIVAPARLPA